MDGFVPSVIPAGKEYLFEGKTPATTSPAPAAGGDDLLQGLIASIKHNESRGNTKAVSPQGAMGAMQIMPNTFKQYAAPGESFENEAHREAAAVRKIQDDFKFFGGDPAKTAAAYIGGRGAVLPDGTIRDDVKDALGTTPRAYAQKVLSRLGKPSSSSQSPATATTEAPKPPPAWAEVTQNPQFESLSFEDKGRMREKYWEEVVLPRVPLGQAAEYRAAFDKDTKPGKLDSAIGKMSDTLKAVQKGVRPVVDAVRDTFTLPADQGPAPTDEEVAAASRPATMTTTRQGQPVLVGEQRRGTAADLPDRWRETLAAYEFSPERFPKPDWYDVGKRFEQTITPKEFASDLWAVVKGTPGGIAAATAAAIEGSDPKTVFGKKGWTHAVIEDARKSARETADEPGAKKEYLLGITREKVRNLPQNLGFSLTSMGAGLAAGIPAFLGGSAVGTPAVGTVAGITTGMAASGLAAYRMDTNGFLRDIREALDHGARSARGKPLTDDEFIAIAGKYSELVHEHGLWEALPEAVGNVVGVGMGKIIFKAAAKPLQGVAGRMGAGAGLLGSELGTETITQTGQHNVEVKAGLSQEPMRSFKSADDLLKSAGEVLPDVLLLTGVIAGGAHVGGRVSRLISGAKPEAAAPGDAPRETTQTGSEAAPAAPTAEPEQQPAQAAAPAADGATEQTSVMQSAFAEARRTIADAQEEPAAPAQAPAETAPGQADAPQTDVRTSEAAPAAMIAPVEQATPTVDAGAHEAASSPLNERKEPSPDQIEAVNYKKGPVGVGPLKGRIENPEGSVRRSKPGAAVQWERTMTQHYGHFSGYPAKAPDGEDVDLFLKPGTPVKHTGPAWVIDQNKEDGSFDEPKVVVGQGSRDEAVKAYLSNYQDGWESRIRGVTELTTEQLQERLNDPKAFLQPQPDATPLTEQQEPAEKFTADELKQAGIGNLHPAQHERVIELADAAAAAAPGTWPTMTEAEKDAYLDTKFGEDSRGQGGAATSAPDRAEARAPEAEPAASPEKPAGADRVGGERAGQGNEPGPEVGTQAQGPGYNILNSGVWQLKPEQSTDSNGLPRFINKRIAIVNGRDVKQEERGEQTLMFDLRDPRQIDANGNAIVLGSLRAQVRADGSVSAIHIIEILSKYRQQGLYHGEAAVASVLMRNGLDNPVRIVGIERDEARPERNALPFWKKLGTRIRNPDATEDESMEGSLSLERYLNALQVRRKVWAGGRVVPLGERDGRDGRSDAEGTGAAQAAGLSSDGAGSGGVQAPAIQPDAGGTAAEGRIGPGADGGDRQGEAPNGETVESDPTETPASAGVSASGDRIADAGENLWYNRRNFTGKALAWNDVAGLNDTLKVKEVVKSKVWPRPDYEQLVADGMEPFFARMLKQVYDGISTSPVVRGTPTDADLQRYINVVGRVREAVFDWAKDNNANRAFLDAIAERAKPYARGGTISVTDMLGAAKADMASVILDRVWPDTAGQRSRFREGEPLADARVIGGNRAVKALQLTLDDAVTAMKDLEKGWPAAQEAWRKQGYQLVEKGKSVRTDKVEQGGDRGALWVVNTGRRGYQSFKTEADAKAFVENMKPWLVLDKRERLVSSHDTAEAAAAAARDATKREGGRSDLRGMNIADSERTGPDRRGADENVGAERLKDEFGFRGVNFGREGWINQAERQAYLNHAHDALLDLAEIMGVPPKALSLNGMLGIAFGAQGRGGAFAAHFVPGVNEINLTKTKGAGALAHEWGHALDHYFGVLAGAAKTANPFLSEARDGAGDGVRSEIRAAFKLIAETMRRRLQAPAEAEAQRNNAKARSTKDLESWIRSARGAFASGIESGKLPQEKARVLEEFDQLADRLRRGDVGEGYVQSGNKKWPQVIAQVRNLYKDATGRVLTLEQTQGLDGAAASVRYYVEGKDAAADHVPQTTPTAYASESARADREKGGKSYWATGREMFARAFETYVADRLERESRSNTFLSDASRMAQMKNREGGFAMPYPRGEDRTRINEAFDKLVSEIKTEETDKGVSMLSRSGVPGLSMERKDADAVANIFRNKLKGLPPVHVMHSREAPVSLKRDMRALGGEDDTAGAWHNGEVYLFHDRLRSPEHAAWVVLHEATHHGLRGMWGQRLNPLLMQLYLSNSTLRKATEQERLRNRKLSTVAAVEEALANMGADGVPQTVMERIVAWVRKTLGELGFKLQVTDSDIKALVADALRFVKTPQNTTHLMSGTAMQPGESKLSRASAQTDTPEFRRWFGDSKAVGADGKPLLVYHGSISGFNTFKPTKSKRMNADGDVIDVVSTAFFLSEDKDTAETFAADRSEINKQMKGGRGGKPQVREFYVSAQNPLDMVMTSEVMARRPLYNPEAPNPDALDILYRYADFPEGAPMEWDEVQAALDDDYVVSQLKDAGYDSVRLREGDGSISWAVFESTQIKSATRNRGTFDPENPDTRLSRGPGGSAAVPGRTAYGSSWDAPEPSKLDDLVYSLQDKHVDTKRVVEAITKRSGELSDVANVYLQEELFHGRAAKRTQAFLDDELRPLFVAMNQRGIGQPELEEYLHARHAPERNEQIARINPELPDGGSGMTTADAKKYLAGLAPDKKQALEALAAKVDAINARTRLDLVQYGLESPSTIAAWSSTYKSYVPLHRADIADGPGTGQGFSVKGSATKRATGSKREVVDILAHVAMQRERAIVRGEKNRVATALLITAMKHPNPEFWAVDKPPTHKIVDPRTGMVSTQTDPLYKFRDNVVSARIPNEAGEVEEHSVVFNESDERAARMAQALKNIDADELGMVLGTVAKFTRFLAAMSTQFNPVFGVVNLTRDVQGGMLNLSTTAIAGKQAQVAKHIFPALRGIYRDLRANRQGNKTDTAWSRLWDEFQRVGGQTGYRDLFRTSEDRAKAIERELKRPTDGMVIKAGGALFGWLSDYNGAMENSVRLAAYKVALDAGLSQDKAASLAKRLTVNFNRRGQAALQVGSLYAFFNASVQGTARLAETLRGPKGKQIVIGGLTLGVVQALALAAAGFDDDEPPEFVRERNVIVPIGDGQYLTVPMPLGFHVLPNVGRVVTEFALSGFREPAKRVAQLLGSLFEAFNPLGSAGLSMQTVAPTIADPFVAISENKDWSGRPISKPKANSLDPVPGHARSRDVASLPSRLVAEAINWLSGGSEFSAGVVSPTADEIDFLVGQVSGGVGREVIKSMQTIGSAYTGEDLPPHKIPLLGRFYGRSDGQSAESARFYGNIRRLNEHELEIEGRAKAGRDTAEYMAEHPEANLFHMANAIERQVQELNKYKRDLLKKDASREEIKAVEQNMTAAMKQLNDRVKEARQ